LARLRHYRRLKKFAIFAASCSLENAVEAATSPIPRTLQAMQENVVEKSAKFRSCSRHVLGIRKMKKNFLKITTLTFLLFFVAAGCKKDINVTGVKLDKKDVTLTVDAQWILTETVFPYNATNKVVSWASNNSSVATVENGVVTAKAAGAATITVITNDGKYTAECEVTVILIGSEVVINGVKWATRNVDAPGTFAASPEDKGMFYQWNRKIGWSSTDLLINSNGGTTWDSSVPTGDSWEKSNDPCPTGWRVPTLEEQYKLVVSGSQWANVNGVNGYIFGRDDKIVFFPAVGMRSAGNGAWGYGYPSQTGYYWSSMPVMDSYEIAAYCLCFHNGRINTNYDLLRGYGFSLRCVSE